MIQYKLYTRAVLFIIVYAAYILLIVRLGSNRIVFISRVALKGLPGWSRVVPGADIGGRGAELLARASGVQLRARNISPSLQIPYKLGAALRWKYYFTYQNMCSQDDISFYRAPFVIFIYSTVWTKFGAPWVGEKEENKNQSNSSVIIIIKFNTFAPFQLMINQI